jgi:hypothetical protein
MVSLGSYTPTGILAAAPQSTSSSEPQLDEFGRARPDPSDAKTLAIALKRREERRLRDRVKAAEALLGLDQPDKDLVIANRLADTSVVKQRLWAQYNGSPEDSNAVPGDLQQVLTSQRGLYTARGEEVRLVEKLSTLSQASAVVMDDVQPELLNIAHILSRLEQFKAAYPTEYQDAYIGESVTELLVPLISLDLSTIWVDLLRASCAADIEPAVASFKSRSWYGALEAYSKQEAASGAGGAESDPASAPRNSMQSMAAQINNLFAEEEGTGEGANGTLMSKVSTPLRVTTSYIFRLRWFIGCGYCAPALVARSGPSHCGPCLHISFAVVHRLQTLCSCPGCAIRSFLLWILRMLTSTTQ